MDSVEGRATAQQTKKRFWKEYNLTEKMGVANILLFFCYCVLTAALVFTANQQYGGLKTDQRPWIKITIDNVQITAPGFIIPVHSINSGKTPAKSFKAQFFLEVVKNGETAKLSETGGHVENTTGVAFPNTQIDTPVPYTFTTSEFQDFKDSRNFFVIYGTASYSDFFHVQHWTKFCQYFGTAPTNAGWVGFTAKNCTDYNDIDDN